MFTWCGTQWRMVIGMGGAYYQGLDYTAVREVMGLLGIPKRDRLAVLGQLQVMEAEAIKHLNQRD